MMTTLHVHWGRLGTMCPQRTGAAHWVWMPAAASTQSPHAIKLCPRWINVHLDVPCLVSPVHGPCSHGFWPGEDTSFNRNYARLDEVTGYLEGCWGRGSGVTICDAWWENKMIVMDLAIVWALITIGTLSRTDALPPILELLISQIQPGKLPLLDNDLNLSCNVQCDQPAVIHTSQRLIPCDTNSWISEYTRHDIHLISTWNPYLQSGVRTSWDGRGYKLVSMSIVFVHFSWLSHVHVAFVQVGSVIKNGPTEFRADVLMTTGGGIELTLYKHQRPKFQIINSIALNVHIL